MATNSSLEDCLSEHNLTLPSPEWLPNRSAIEMCKFAVNILGVGGNLTLFIILQKRHLGSRMATLFFSCQCILDLVVCLMSAIHIIQPAMWLVGYSDFTRILICKGWHSLVFYLYFIQFSILNIVLIGLERYWAVVKPLMYQKLKTSYHGRICIFIIAVYSVLFAIPNLWETQYRKVCGTGLCIGQVFTIEAEIMLQVYSVMWFIFIYFLPLMMLVFLYGRVIRKLQTSQKVSRSSQKDRATEQFTRMAIVVTIVYVLCITYDAFAYMLGRTGLMEYNYNTIAHQLGMFVISLNSCANPYIYFFFVMRSSFVNMMRRRAHKRYPTIAQLIDRNGFQMSSSSSSRRKDSLSSERSRRGSLVRWWIS